MNRDAIDKNNLADFEDFIARQIAKRGEPQRSDLEAYLRRWPGMSVKDWKGKGLTWPTPSLSAGRDWYYPGDRRPELLEEATSKVARELYADIRRAAAFDPRLIWNPLARKYRLRLPDDPAPSNQDPASAAQGAEATPAQPLPTGEGRDASAPPLQGPAHDDPANRAA